MNIDQIAASLNYISVGAGPPVILIHGLAASIYDWTSLMPRLVSAGYNAIAVDLFGHGDSPKPDNPTLYTWEAIYTILEKWLTTLNIAPPYILVSHSLGGSLSLQYSLQHQQNVRAMVLIAPFFSQKQLSSVLQLFNRQPDLGRKLIPYLPPQLITTVLGWDPITRAGFSPQARLQIAIDLKRASPHIFQIPHSISDFTPHIGTIMPVSKVIWGERDRTLRPGSFHTLVDRMPGATGQSLYKCGHQPHLGRAGFINQSVLEFLDRLPV